MEQSDIVVKLHEEGLGWGIGPALLCQQAAAEITRLRVAMAEAVPASQIRAEALREKVAALPRYSVRPNGNEIGMRMTRTGEWYFGPDVLRLIDTMIQEAGR